MIGYTQDNYKQYRVGYLLDKSSTKQAFRYHKLNRIDVQSVEVLKNFDFDYSTFIINTLSVLNFNIESKIELDGKKYKVVSYYEEEQTQYDGNITNKVSTIKYLVLGK